VDAAAVFGRDRCAGKEAAHEPCFGIIGRDVEA
jgi:hypothetical protein